MEKIRISVKKGVISMPDVEQLTINEVDHFPGNINTCAVSRIQERDDVITVKSNTGSYLESFGNFFEMFENELSVMHLKHKDMNTIYELSEKLVNECFKIISKHEVNTEENVKEAHIFITKAFSNSASRYRRQKKELETKQYTESKEKAVGLKWKAGIDKQSGIARHYLVQEKFTYVSILEQLQALFADEIYFKMYFEHNAKQRIPGTYSDYSSGSNFISNGLFQSVPDAIQLQLAIDDCQFACALKNRTTTHKITCIYMQVKNIPPEFLSRVDSIHVVALCPSISLKQEYTNLDNIMELIVSEIRSLERDGIRIRENVHLRGTLINVCYDNLGGNGLYGMTESFNSNFYCRHCEAHKSELQTMSAEDPEKMRNKSQYKYYMQKLDNCTDVDLDATKGYKGHCLLNDLEFFHILDNNSLDLMHDLNEGILPYLLETLFEYMVSKKIITKREIIARVRDYNYGILNQSSRPSPLKFEKKNLGQHAAQAYCLFTNIPFMLIDLKSKLSEVWIIMETMLSIMQILYSKTIKEADITRLETLIRLHMEKFKEIFGVKFIPKYHFLLHYPNVIRKMGPPATMWMFRYESKHQQLKSLVVHNKNFSNLPKTIGDRHQESLPPISLVFSDEIKPSKLKLDQNSPKLIEYQNVLNSGIVTEMSQISTLNTVKYNGCEYRAGLIMIYDSRPFEITLVLSDTINYFLLLQPYEVVKFNSFCNSYVIKRSSNPGTLIKLNKLNNKKTHNKVISENQINVIASSLEIFSQNM